MLKIHVSKLLTALVNGQLAAPLIVAYLTSTLEKAQSLRLAASPALPLLPTPSASPGLGLQPFPSSTINVPYGGQETQTKYEGRARFE